VIQIRFVFVTHFQSFWKLWGGRPVGISDVQCTTNDAKHFGAWLLPCAFFPLWFDGFGFALCGTAFEALPPRVMKLVPKSANAAWRIQTRIVLENFMSIHIFS